MAQHGYLREYDEGWDRGDDRNRRERDWREREQGSRQPSRDRDRGFILGDDDPDYSRGQDREDRGFFERMSDEARSWFGSDDHDERHRDYQAGRRSFSSHPDDHYRSWRERQMEMLDRDYQEYCREREQEFHQNFDSWRQNRQRQQSQQSQGSQDELVLSSAARSDASTPSVQNERPATSSPEGAATLGTNNSENSATSGRGRR